MGYLPLMQKKQVYCVDVPKEWFCLVLGKSLFISCPQLWFSDFTLVIKFWSSTIPQHGESQMRNILRKTIEKYRFSCHLSLALLIYD